MRTSIPRDHRAPGDYARTWCGRRSHLVMVYRACRWRRQGACTCGWTGARRFLRGWAVVDALVHAGNSGHEPALPLVVDTTLATLGPRAVEFAGKAGNDARQHFDPSALAATPPTRLRCTAAVAATPEGPRSAMKFVLASLWNTGRYRAFRRRLRTAAQRAQRAHGRPARSDRLHRGGRP